MAGNRKSDKEIHERIMHAYKLRFENDKPIRQEDWVELCHEKYGDKSEQQYCQYFTKARDVYEENWKQKLQNMLSPAADELFRLLSSEDEKIRQRAIDQIMKYTGNDIQKVDVKGSIETINVGFQTEQ